MDTVRRHQKETTSHPVIDFRNVSMGFVSSRESYPPHNEAQINRIMWYERLRLRNEMFAFGEQAVSPPATASAQHGHLSLTTRPHPAACTASGRACWNAGTATAAASAASSFGYPDKSTSKGWTETNPLIHADKATAANAAFGGEWKGMVRMAKRWNQEKGKPINPSFLLEVMALQILRPPFNGNYPYEFMAFFATAKDRIMEDWADPAGLGPPVSDSMTTADRSKAAVVLGEASLAVRNAIQLGKNGQEGAALKAYRELFGELFPLS